MKFLKNLSSNILVKSTKIRKSIATLLRSANLKRKNLFKRVYLFIQRKPFTAFFAVLGIFLLLMILGNLFFSPKPEKVAGENTAKIVRIYKVGSAPQISYQGKIEKSGVVKIVAQNPGIVESINVSEGQQIGAGTNILSLASNYSGGNALSVARQIAAEQYQNTNDTYNTQKDIIAKQRDTADKNRDNGATMRDIANQSAQSTSDLINIQQDIVNGLQSNVDNATPTTKLAAEQALAPYKSGLVQLQSSYQNLQLQSNGTSTDLANLNHDIAIKQLDLQERALKTTLDVAGLQLRMAQINEASMFPSTPFSGTVNKIFVHVGDSVNPGTPLAQISGNSQHAEVVVYVPENIAANVSSFEASTLYFDNQTIHLTPTFISKDATSGTLYSIIYDLGDLSISNLTDQAYIEVSVPIGVAKTTNEDPFVPLDAVVQTQEEAFIYVDENGVARAKKITLGQIQGGYVEALTGVPQNAVIILDRNVIEGDKVSVSR